MTQPRDAENVKDPAHKNRPEVLFQQNHCEVFRTDSAGADWQAITRDLPSRFDLALALHSVDPNTIYALPEDKVTGPEVGDDMRLVSDAKFRVFCSRNAGEDREPLMNGLPHQNAYLHVMREGMATDSLYPCGIYIGASTGQVFYNRDDGDS